MAKVKIVGFKVGKAKPTYNKTIEIPFLPKQCEFEETGRWLFRALNKSDFLSIRKIEGKGELRKELAELQAKLDFADSEEKHSFYDGQIRAIERVLGGSE